MFCIDEGIAATFYCTVFAFQQSCKFDTVLSIFAAQRCVETHPLGGGEQKHCGQLFCSMADFSDIPFNFKDIGRNDASYTPNNHITNATIYHFCNQ